MDSTDAYKCQAQGRLCTPSGSVSQTGAWGVAGWSTGRENVSRFPRGAPLAHSVSGLVLLEELFTSSNFSVQAPKNNFLKLCILDDPLVLVSMGLSGF